jgi:hypothetical protein
MRNSDVLEFRLSLPLLDRITEVLMHVVNVIGLNYGKIVCVLYFNRIRYIIYNSAKSD